MLKWFLRRQLAGFERSWNYDASYPREMIETDPQSLMTFWKVQGLSQYRKDVPLAPYCAAGIVAVMSEDCGPCTQLGIDMAERAGVDPAILRAVVARDFQAMPFEVALAVRFTEATLRHAPEADDLREEVVRHWGQRGLISLGFRILAARIYPTLKYALGHGQACTRLKIGGETRPVLTMTTHDTRVENFEAHRRALTGLAYRMLGSRAEAEDVVQDAYLRWHAADQAEIREPRHYLGTIVTRLCLDRMKSARARRELYVGQWLPEPVVDEAFDDSTAGDLAHDISVALMLVLERLSPLERASFLLHDVFGLDFAEVARALGRREASCRQLAARARARAHIEDGRPRFATSREEGHRLATAFQKAAASGDTAALQTILAEDVVLYSDGGGKRAAALNPIHGADKVMRFFDGILRKNPAFAAAQTRPAIVNGLAGFVVREEDGAIDTLAFAHRDGRITAIYATRNPDKLQHVRF